VKGIIKSRRGYRAFVKVGTVQREKRYPADTKLSTMTAWRDETRVALRKKQPAPAQPGSL
jgi:hypothetical protein